MHRYFTPLLILLTLPVFPRQATELRADKPKPPNIIFFLSDDQRSTFMGCAGHPVLKTPTMDALAKRGVRFENMFVTTSICAASRATLLTGLYERSHKYTFGTPPIAKEMTAASYPAVLKKSGYRTGFIGKFGVGVHRGETQEMFDLFRPLNRSPYFKKQADGTTRHITQIAGDYAIEFLKQQTNEKPFCLAVCYNAPHAEDSDKANHYPYPKAVAHLYEGMEMPKPELSDPAIYDSQPEFLKKSLNRERYFWRWDTAEKYQKNLRNYYRMISGVDHSMGRVLDEIKAQGLAENTVVIFSGDNGYYAASRGFAGKWSHYEESLRVPLIIHDPRVSENQRGKVNPNMVLNVDIPATILSYATVKIPQSYQGESLKPLVNGATVKKWRTDFFCEHLMNHPGIPKWEGVRDQRYVYANYFQQEKDAEFLHDLKTDPHELKNLLDDPKSQDILKQMRARCIELRDSYGGEYTLEKFPSNRGRRKPKPKPTKAAP